MRRAAGIAALVVTAAAAAVVVFAVFERERDAPAESISAILPTVTATPPARQPTPLPATWIDGLTTAHDRGVAGQRQLISCLDTNGDGRLDAADGYATAALDIELDPADTCGDSEHHSDFYTGVASDPMRYACTADPAPAIIVAIGSAGTDLMEPSAGESLGVLDIVNQLQTRVGEAQIATLPVLTAPAIFGALPPQTSMERWLAADLARALDAMPCLRAVLIGHSHGGVTVSSVTAALDDRYASRVLGVMIDRTTKLYDRDAMDMPARTQLLNVFQTNEGWHGSHIDAPNVANIDESGERAPVALSDGGGGLALVSHKTLDDSTGVQHRIVDAVTTWLSAAR